MSTSRAASTRETLAVEAGNTRTARSGGCRLLRLGALVLLLFLVQACSDDGSNAVVVPDGPESQPRGTLAIEPASFLLTEGETLKMTATLSGVPLAASQLSWNLTPPGPATIDPDGLLTGVRHGEVTVTARFKSVEGTASGTVRAVPDHIRILNADVAGTVGRAIGDSIGVLVESKDSFPVPGVEVAFDASTGDGNLSHSARTTDKDGVARVLWTLGTTAGSQALRARAEGLGEAMIHAEAIADYDSAQVVPLAGDGQEGTVATYLSEPLMAGITDQYGNPLPGMGLEWSFGNGGGAQVSDGNPAAATKMIRTTADAHGEAQIKWKLGPEAGTQEAVLAPIPGPSSASGYASEGLLAASDNGQKKGWFKWNAHGKPSAPDMVIVTPEEASILVGEQARFEATLADAFGNAIEGGVFEWRTDNSGAAQLVGDGLVEGISEGRAAVFVLANDWNLGGSAWVNVAIRVPASIQVQAGNGQDGVVGQPLAEPISVVVLDGDGRPVQGAAVNWHVVARSESASGSGVEASSVDGGLSSSQTHTNEQGIAQTQWTLGTEPGEQVIEAVVGSLSPIDITAEASVGPPANVAVEPAALTIAEGDTGQFTASVFDQFGNAIVGAGITWSSSDPTVATIDEDGTATAVNAGSCSIEARVDEAAGTAQVQVPAEITYDLEKVGGDGQSGPVGSMLPEPLRVRVMGSDGAPQQGRQVQWQVVSGGGTLSASETITDAQGYAEVVWTLGAEAGENGASAMLPGSSGGVAFSATGEAGSVVLTPDSLVLSALNETSTLTATASSSLGEQIQDAVFTWSSSDPAVASVSEGGVVTSKGWGEALIIATAACCSASDTSVVTVQQAVVDPARIEMTLDSASFEESVWIGYSASVVNSDVQNPGVTVTASDPSTVLVTDNGLLGLQPGTSWIIGTYGDLRDSVAVEVLPTQVSTLEVSPSQTSLDVGASLALQVTALNDAHQTVTGRVLEWNTSNAGVATVADGHVTAGSPGTALVSVSVGGTTGSASITVIDNTVQPAPSGYYGNVWTGDGLTNLEIGKYTGRAVAHRFRAKHTGYLQEVRVYFVSRTGYGAGDGGQIRVQVRTDDGSSGHFPSSQVLGSALVTDPMASKFRTLQFDQPVPIQEGQLYHLVYTNTASDPVSNYVSIDHLHVRDGTPPNIQPTIPDTDFAVVWKYRDGSPWKLALTHTPIVDIRYTDGFVQGEGYVDVGLGSIQTVSGSAKVRELFTVHGGNKTVTHVSVRLQRTGGSGPAVIRLESSDGAVLEEGLMAVGTTRDWYTYQFNTPRQLLNGQTYSLVVSASSGSSFEIYPLVEGVQYGFQTPSIFTDGRAQYFNGSWNNVRSRTDYDYQLYFTVAGN